MAFVRAKYEALMFVLPTGGPTATAAWRRIVSTDRSLSKWFPPGLRSYETLTSRETDTGTSRGLDGLAAASQELPKRLMDYFCVIGHQENAELVSTENGHLTNMDTPESLALKYDLIDCFPPVDTHKDMDYPEHIGRFVLPDGCQPSHTQEPAKFFTFVLTTGNGSRLYCGALRVYDEVIETAELQRVLENSGYTGTLPWWLKQGSSPGDRPSELVYLPKCLVLISHYPFFDVMRFVLSRLYRVAIAESPVPIERYVSNFMLEVPLPPQGRVEVMFGFTNLSKASISRPPPNDLPLVNFSFRPLFQCLSVTNVLVTIGCLLTETRVVLCSRFAGLLTPCTEALLSLLFPLEWQGMYIPTLPYNMTELFEAPVPFLLGIHSKYLSAVEAKHRPHGVVFVDLDKDQVHLGSVDVDAQDGDIYHSHTPQLPERDAIKLRSKLDEFADPAFLLPANGIKGLITINHGTMLQSTARDSYARMETVAPVGSVKRTRLKKLANNEIAFADSDMSTLDGFISEQGHLTGRAEKAKAGQQKKTKNRNFSRMLRRFGGAGAAKTSGGATGGGRPGQGVGQSSDGDIGIDSFDQTEIRMAFLRFFVSIFNRYDEFITPSKAGFSFKKETFLDSLNLSFQKRDYMSAVVDTQMFQRFLEERHENPHDPEIQFFDESIVAKNNRSMRVSFTTGKRETPFLDDKSYKVWRRRRG